jgi:NAD-dependent deacetylase
LKETVTPANIEYTHTPKEVSAAKAAEYLKDCKAIMILTGAGLSAASGIPTFRGDNGFWTKSYEGFTDPTEILTLKCFSSNP